jgi:hypothetical protein
VFRRNISNCLAYLLEKSSIGEGLAIGIAAFFTIEGVFDHEKGILRENISRLGFDHLGFPVRGFPPGGVSVLSCTSNRTVTVNAN